jgi:hypothetical protein
MLLLAPFASLLLAAGGPISGVVHLAGRPPARPALPVTQDADTCGASVPDESLVVDAAGEVANAVVFLEAPPPNSTAAPASPPPSVTLDQRGCRFTPHVLAAQVGATLVALNSDPVLHTVHATGAHHRFAFDAAMPFKGAKRALPLDRAGQFGLTCNAGHRWMHAWLHVFDHPYFAVTDAHGRFTLPSVPPGTYALAVWQERLGERHFRVKVGARGAKPITMELSPETP